MTRAIASKFLSLYVVALLCCNSFSFVLLPRGRSTGMMAPSTAFVTSKTITTQAHFNPKTPLQANYNGQDFRDDLKRLSKVTGRAAMNVGKAALNGLSAGIRGLAQDESVKNGADVISKSVQQGVKGIQNIVGETRDNEQVQKGIDRLKRIVDESQKRVKETLFNANQQEQTTFSDDTYFDREDEELFRGIPNKQPEITVDAEILDVRVIGGTTDRVIDAEIVSKTWNR